MRVRRRLFIVLGLLACLLLAGCVAWLLWPRTAITRENAVLIRQGMTVPEVEAILVGPARDETTGPCTVDQGEEAVETHGTPGTPGLPQCHDAIPRLVFRPGPCLRARQSGWACYGLRPLPHAPPTIRRARRSASPLAAPVAHRGGFFARGASLPRAPARRFVTRPQREPLAAQRAARRRRPLLIDRSSVTWTRPSPTRSGEGHEQRSSKPCRLRELPAPDVER
jgi:hypothetical protein